MSTSTTTNLNLIKDNSNEPIINLRTHLNNNLDALDGYFHTLDESLGSILPKFNNSGAIKSLDDNQKLSIQYGGTGLTSSPSMLINLGSTSSDTVLKASPRPGVTGTLPVANGGTGNASPWGTDVIANVVTAASNCEIVQVGYWQWGMLAQIFLAIKVKEAKSAGSVIATLVSGKQPAITTPLMNTATLSNFCAAYANGQIQTKATLSANTTVYVVGAYIIKP